MIAQAIIMVSALPPKRMGGILLDDKNRRKPTAAN